MKRLLERLSTHCELISKAVADDSRPFFPVRKAFCVSRSVFFLFYFFLLFFYSFNANCGQSWGPWFLFFDQFDGFVLFSLIFWGAIFLSSSFYLTLNMAVIQWVNFEEKNKTSLHDIFFSERQFLASLSVFVTAPYIFI